MKKSFLWLGSILLILQIIGCREHECPTPITHTANPQPAITHLTLTDAAISDAGVNSYYPSTNRGADGRIHVCAWTFDLGNFGATRTFMNFDLSAIPVDATILTAELTLYADTTNNYDQSRGHNSLTGSNEWKIKRVTSDWRENLITWATQPTSDPLGVINMPESTSGDETYVVDIATFLNDQLKNPDKYYGIVLQLKTEVRYRVIAFCSKEHKYAATLKPKLKITYSK